ncbi:DUF5694 domain-containing protein [Sphingomonas swuensis]|uniref:DUF5694 domain-containing protein n=1 Tax=Sphingomonas swuensis TaxID=977800 RepID=A0ABP7SS75_9SPHN
MRLHTTAAICVLLIAAPAAAAPSHQPPLGFNPPVAGTRTAVLNVGSAHLSELPSIKAEQLEPLIANLARFRPTIITVENVSGEQCDMMRRSPRHKDAWESYCADPSAAQKAVGLTQQEAEAQSEATFDRFAAPGAKPTPADRRRLALLLLAANERASAWVQWLRLPPAERIAADGLDAEMVRALGREGRKLNESYNVAAQLAARLGLERIAMVDDHSSDAALGHAGKAYEAAMGARFAGFRDDPLFKDYEAQSRSVVDGRSLLAFYRYLNDPARLSRQVRADFGGAAADRKAYPYGRMYAAWWDVRNLRMAANIRVAMAEQPGARVLNIVGASHKPWYDAWMRQMSDVEVVGPDPYLR